MKKLSSCVSISVAYNKWPDADLFGKVDDDLFGCSEKLMYRFEELKIDFPSKFSRLYYGWAHPYPKIRTLWC